MAPRRTAKPVAFASADAFRAWLERHHATSAVLEVRLFKKHAASRGMGYADALAEALCFGWIDGVTHSIDDDSYRVRFTPRKRGSRWSLANIRRAKRLTSERRMHPAGLRVFRARDESDARRYSFETRPVALAPEFTRKFRAASAAWSFFQAQPPWYRRTSSFWVMSANRPETQMRRLTELIARSEESVWIGPLAQARQQAVKRKTKTKR